MTSNGWRYGTHSAHVHGRNPRRHRVGSMTKASESSARGAVDDPWTGAAEKRTTSCTHTHASYMRTHTHADDRTLPLLPPAWSRHNYHHHHHHPPTKGLIGRRRPCNNRMRVRASYLLRSVARARSRTHTEHHGVVRAIYILLFIVIVTIIFNHCCYYYHKMLL